MTPAEDDVTSLSAIGGNPDHGPLAFATTHWSVVLEAQGESPAAQEALEKLCRIYWRPIYSFLRRQGIGAADAEDLTQGFFASLLQHRNLNAVRKEEGRLRSYLLGALKYFLGEERRRAMAIKRGKGQRLIPLEELRADERFAMEPADPVTADLIYERRWASTVLERALNLLKDEYHRAGNAALFDSLKQLLPGEPDAPPHKRHCRAIGHDRKCGPAGVLPISAALPIIIARGDRSYSCDTRAISKMSCAI